MPPSAAHFFRISSAYRGQREHVHKKISFLPQKLDVKDKAAFIESLRLAVYTACLASFIQGISIISAANRENKWSIGKLTVKGEEVIDDKLISTVQTTPQSGRSGVLAASFKPTTSATTS